MNQCLKCKSKNVISGRIVASGRVPVFEPDVDMRIWSFSVLNGTRFKEEAFACLDCGLVWGATSAEELREFIQKHHEIKNQSGQKNQCAKTG